MRASILYLVGLVDYANANTAAIYNVTANTIVQQQPYESSNIAASSVDIDSQQLDIFIDTQNPQPQSEPQSSASYKQGYQQTIEVSSQEFINEELIIYQQTLLEGYANSLLGYIDDAETDEEVSIKIIEQELTTLYGANSTSKNLLTLSFVLSHNNNNNDGDSATTTIYEEYTNTNLNDMTSKLQSANLPVVQVFDIKSNDELDYNLESIISTESPTDQPTAMPTEQQSTMIPSVSPVGDRAVTSSPTDSLGTPFPTVSLSDSLPALNNVMNYVVDSKMLLYSSRKSGGQTAVDAEEFVLSDEQMSNWEEITQDYIQKSIQSTIIDNSAEGSDEESEGGLEVTVSLNSYRVLSPQNEEVEQPSNLRRRLQQVSNEDTIPLELDFTTNIQLSKQPQEEKVLDGNELVATTFRSVESQSEYITLLNDSTSEEEEDTNDIMNNVQSITLEVDNEIVTESSNKEEDKTVVFEEVEAETQSTNNEELNERDMLMYIIIIVLGATFLLSITVCCCCGGKKSKKNEESNKSKSLAESDSMAAGGYDIEQHQEDTSSEDGSTKYDTAGSQSSQSSNSSSSQAAVYHSINIKAPSGKLGLVLVNNVTNDLAGITRIKDDSILLNQVNVGDLLLSVDEIDCRGMMACDVSELIGSRCENDERVLVLLREA